MTNEERKIINGLLEKDNKITKVFFFTKCRPMFHNIIHNVFRDKADYDELVNELYLYLMENDGRRIRLFGQHEINVNDQETAYAFFKWLKTTAWRFFANKAENEQSKEEKRKFVMDENGEEIDVEIEDINNRDPEIIIDANIYFNMIKLERDREVLKKYFVEGLEPDVISEKLGISKENLYNIKKRALNRLQQVARHATSNESLCSIICEQYAMDIFGVHKSLESLRELSEQKGWLTETGVALDNIGALCCEFGLPIKKKAGGRLKDIAMALESGSQVIAAVDGGELTGNQIEEEIEDAFFGQISDHCVIVLAVEEDTLTLYDPGFGYTPLTILHDHFVDAWEDSGCYYVEIKPCCKDLY